MSINQVDISTVHCKGHKSRSGFIINITPKLFLVPYSPFSWRVYLSPGTKMVRLKSLFIWNAKLPGCLLCEQTVLQESPQWERAPSLCPPPLSLLCHRLTPAGFPSWMFLRNTLSVIIPITAAPFRHPSSLVRMFASKIFSLFLTSLVPPDFYVTGLTTPRLS